MIQTRTSCILEVYVGLFVYLFPNPWFSQWSRLIPPTSVKGLISPARYFRIFNQSHPNLQKIWPILSTDLTPPTPAESLVYVGLLCIFFFTFYFILLILISATFSRPLLQKLWSVITLIIVCTYLGWFIRQNTFKTNMTHDHVCCCFFLLYSLYTMTVICLICVFQRMTKKQKMIALPFCYG